MEGFPKLGLLTGGLNNKDYGIWGLCWEPHFWQLPGHGQILAVYHQGCSNPGAFATTLGFLEVEWQMFEEESYEGNNLTL